MSDGLRPEQIAVSVIAWPIQVLPQSRKKRSKKAKEQTYNLSACLATAANQNLVVFDLLGRPGDWAGARKDFLFLRLPNIG